MKLQQINTFIKKELSGWKKEELAGILIVLPVIWGAIRGLKKSVFRFLWVIAFGVICFFVSGIV